MTRLERKAVAFARKFKGWDYFIAACEGYLHGAKDDGSDIEVDNTGHQLTHSKFEAYANQPFKLQLKQGVGNYKIVDIFVKEEDGVVSFQGTAKIIK